VRLTIAAIACVGVASPLSAVAQSLSELAEKGYELKGQSSVFVEYSQGGSNFKVIRTIWTLQKEKVIVVCARDQELPLGIPSALSCFSQ